MPWFRLEDNFHQHPKVVRAGNAATGLWVRCATYSATYLTDGQIPAEVARNLGKTREIDTLLDAGMWLANTDGFWIPDYLQYNPSKEQVLADRAAARERQAKKRRNDNGKFE